MFHPKTILVLAPHTDDGELGCGGAISRFVREGAEVYYAAFCLCASTLPAGLAANTLEKECRKATSILGIPESNLMLFNYEVRELPNSRQGILEEMRKMNAQLAPGMVFLPAQSDVHQDHRVVYEEGMRAFKHTSVAGYEMPWNNYSFKPDLFFRLEEQDISKKLEALRAYQSQAARDYMHEDFNVSLAKVRGLQAGHRYAEAFEVYRWIY